MQNEIISADILPKKEFQWDFFIDFHALWKAWKTDEQGQCNTLPQKCFGCGMSQKCNTRIARYSRQKIGAYLVDGSFSAFLY